MKNRLQNWSKLWSNQTDLGKKFGISAIAVGKILVEAELKDPITKRATKKALSENMLNLHHLKMERLTLCGILKKFVC